MTKTDLNISLAVAIANNLNNLKSGLYLEKLPLNYYMKHHKQFFIWIIAFWHQDFY